MLLLPTTCGPGPPLPATTKPTRAKTKTKTKNKTTTTTAATTITNIKDIKKASDNFTTTTTQNSRNNINAGVVVAVDDCSKSNGQQEQQQQQESSICHQNISNSATCHSQHFKLAKAKAKRTTTTTATTLLSSTILRTTTKTTNPKWLLMLMLMLFGILAQAPRQVAAEKSKHYHMQSLCKNHFLQQIYRKIDGAVLWSQNERNLDCIITFQTHSILQRFMLRFDMLQLDCNDHLYVYDGAHAVANPKIDISCRQTKQSVSSILTRTNFVTLKYVTDGWGTDSNGFKLVITSVKDTKHACKDFTCSSREFCINRDLLCDGINHCGDNSDESVDNLCQSESSNTIFGMDMTWFVLIVVSLLLTMSALVVGISICLCRRKDDSNVNQNTPMQSQFTAETNGSSKHLHYHHHHGGGTLTREHTQLPPTSGNWHHPAGPSGYHRIPHNLLLMATKVRPIWCLANSVN